MISAGSQNSSNLSQSSLGLGNGFLSSVDLLNIALFALLTLLSLRMRISQSDIYRGKAMKNVILTSKASSFASASEIFVFIFGRTALVSSSARR